MRVFENYPKEKICPVCKTNKEGKSCLVGIYGTQEGFNIEAEIVHIDCLDLMIDKDMCIIYQKYER